MKDNSPIKAAFIGGFFVLIAALIPYLFLCNFEKPVYKLKITNIVLNNIIPIQGIRINACINGEDISFPSKTFALLKPEFSIPNQSFSISKNSSYDCSFEIVALDNGCEFHHLRQINSLILKKNEINSGIYKVSLYESISDYLNESKSIQCLVEFKIYKSDRNNE